MARSEGAVADGDSLAIIRTTSDLNHVIAVADIAVFNKIIFSTQIDSIGVGRGPRRRNAESRAINAVHGAQGLDMKLGRILHRDSH